MKQLPWILTVLVAASTAQIGLADEANKDKNAVLEAIKSKSTSLSLGGALATGAYLTRDVQVYREGIYPLPMNEMKEADIMKRVDEMLKKADTSHIPNKGIINKARILVVEQNRPIVVIASETPNSVAAARASTADALKIAAAPADKTGVAGLITKLLGLSKVSKEKIEQDVIKDGGKPYLQAQIDGLKADKQVTTPKAFVTSARQRLANRASIIGAGVALAYAGGSLAIDLNSLDQVSGEIKSCAENKDGSIICDNAGAAKRKPANESGGIVLNGQNAANGK